ncbi:hypothetical protein DSO57_1027752 [Entomophthora muscae]|uniref:Uncharacterized protein n=1 Tax=Entomophthora muscae TaxID=34485 RepID=A0ACC2UMQ4_9FUNG|nr:hypothetical protein DSO57_1027752 [Entomophthora muscae]
MPRVTCICYEPLVHQSVSIHIFDALHLHTPKRQYPPTGIDSQTPVDKTKAFDYYRPPNAPFGPVHFTEYPPNPDHKPWTLEDLQWYTCPNAPKEPYQIVCDGKKITIYPLIFNRKYNNPAAYLVPMEPPLTPKPTISTPPTSDATGQSGQFLRVLYLALTGFIDSFLPAAEPWDVAEKALSYLVKFSVRAQGLPTLIHINYSLREVLKFIIQTNNDHNEEKGN